MHSRRQLAAELRGLGVSPGDVVMAHASVRAIGEVAGGPDEIHLAVKDALTPDGTLMMYPGCPRYVDEVGRGNLTADEEAEVLEKLPPFDADVARADRTNGTLVEFFRSYSDTRVNRHVVRFAVWGRQGSYLISTQPWDFAFGRESALERLVALDGKILLLGSDLDAVTFLHYAEHIVDIPNKRIARFKVPVLANGIRVWRDMAEYDTSTGAHANWPPDFFARIVRGHLSASRNQGGRVGDALCYLMRARELLEFALPVMREVAANPAFASPPSPGLPETRAL